MRNYSRYLRAGALLLFAAATSAAHAMRLIEARELLPGELEVRAYRTESITTQGVTWKHDVVIVRPLAVKSPRGALITMAVGAWQEGDAKARATQAFQIVLDALNDGGLKSLAARGVAKRIGSFSLPIVIVTPMPFEPMRGKRAAELAQESFDRFLDAPGSADLDHQTFVQQGVASSAKLIGQIQSELTALYPAPIDRFVLMGGSFSAWTGFQTFAEDPRIVGFIPLVFGFVGMEERITHQRAVWGDAGEARAYVDYFDRNKSRLGALIPKIDPQVFLRQTTKPVLHMLATNDPYFPSSGVENWWRERRDYSNLWMVPNLGHNLTFGSSTEIVESLRFLGVAESFAGAAIDGTYLAPAPELRLAGSASTAQKITVEMHAGIRPRQWEVWRAGASSRDFRHSTWTQLKLAKPVEADGPTGRRHFDFILPSAVPTGKVTQYLVRFAWLDEKGREQWGSTPLLESELNRY